MGMMATSFLTHSLIWPAATASTNFGIVGMNSEDVEFRGPLEPEPLPWTVSPMLQQQRQSHAKQRTKHTGTPLPSPKIRVYNSSPWLKSHWHTP